MIRSTEIRKHSCLNTGNGFERQCQTRKQKKDYDHIMPQNNMSLLRTNLVRISIERCSNDCRKTKTKAITPTNHNRNEQRDDPITIPSNHL